MKATDEQLTSLLQYCGNFARQISESSGEFHPFGAAIDDGGQLRAPGFDDGSQHSSARNL